MVCNIVCRRLSGICAHNTDGEWVPYYPNRQIATHLVSANRVVTLVRTVSTLQSQSPPNSVKTTPGTSGSVIPDWPLPPPAASGAATPGDRPWANPRARWPGHHIIPPTRTQLPGPTRHRVIGQEPSPLPSRRWSPLIFRCTVPERVILVFHGYTHS